MTSAAFLLWVALAPAQVLGLTDAVRTAQKNQPQLRQQHATTEASEAQRDVARAALLPQLTGNLGYQRASLRTGSVGSVGGGGAGLVGGAGSTDRLLGANYWSGSLSLVVPIYDFGQSLGAWRAAQAQAESQRSTETAARQQVVLNVRLAFFQARAQRALVRVAKDTLSNQRLHQKQIEGFVQVGTRPRIDLAQAGTNLANAELQRILAENNYVTARAELNLAMGVVGSLDFEVADETLPPVAGEDGPGEALVQRALGARPELAALAHRQESQRQTLRSARGAYFPTLGAAAGASESGESLTDLQLNWSAAVTLSWPIFSGLATRSQVRGARASLTALEAQLDTEAQQIRLDVTTAAVAVGGAKAAIVAAVEARRNAREQLRLAEGRYLTGVGNSIELSDAQTAATQAEAQVIQAEFNLASARARLLGALGEK